MLTRFLRGETLACLFLLLTAAVCAAAQVAETEALTVIEPKNEFGIIIGASPDSSTAFGIGRTPDARYGTIAVRYARRFDTGNTVNLKYTADAIPLALINYPDFEIVPTGVNSFRGSRERRTARAFGVAPLGLQVNFRPLNKFQPFAGASGGVLYFDKRIPRATGTRFVYTADLGAGLEIKLNDDRAVTFGYKYLHLSNGGRGVENPGFDQNLFYVGYSFAR